MPEKRPEIPEEIKRKVRQECYFGCVICGSPFFDYDHIVPYSQVKEHTVENLALLCRTHHNDKTPIKNPRLSIERVLEARINPFNKDKSYTSSYKLVDDKNLKVMLGCNEAKKTFDRGDDNHYVIWNSGYSFFTIHADNGYICFSLSLTDSDGNLLLTIDKGEIKVTTQEWDYNFKANRLKIWRKQRELLFDANLSGNLVHIHKGAFINKHNDGFIVKNRQLLAVRKNKSFLKYVDCFLYDNNIGAWAMYNPTYCEQKHPPIGFGSVCCSDISYMSE